MMKKHIAKLLVLAMILSMLPFTVAADIPEATHRSTTIEKQAADTGLINSMTVTVADGTPESSTPKLEWFIDKYSTSLDVILLEGKDKVTLDISYAVNGDVTVKGYKDINYKPTGSTPSVAATETNKISFGDLDRGTHFLWLVATKDQITYYYHLTVRVTDSTTEYNIKVNCPNGIATASATKAVAGTEITITATPNEGYTIDPIYYIANGATSSTLVTDRKFIMPGADITVDVTCAKTMYSTIVTPPVNGTATIAATEAPTEGATIVVATTPDEDYKLDTISVTGADGSNVPVTNGSFIMPGQNVTITVTFVAKDADDYDVRIDKDVKNGVIAANPTAAPAGTDVLLTVIPTTNYKLDTFKVTTQAGVEVETTAVECGYKFTMPVDAQSIIVTATFRGIGPNAEKHKITITNAVHGSVSTHPTNEAREEESVYITAIPDDGYVIDSVIATDANGTVNVKDGIFLMPRTDVTLTVTFKEIPSEKHEITIADAVHGSVTTSPANEASKGEEVTITATPEDGYTLDTLMVENDETSEPVNIADGKFTMPAGNVTVKAVFKVKEDEKPDPVPATHTVTVKVLPEEGGTVETNVKKAAVGEEVTVTFTTNDGYVVKSITVNEEAAESIPENDRYQFSMPSEDAVVQVEFKPEDAKIEYSVTTEAIPEEPAFSTPMHEEDRETVKETVTGSKIDAAEAAHELAVEVVKDQSIVDQATSSSVLTQLGLGAGDANKVEIIVKPVVIFEAPEYTKGDRPVMKFEIKGFLEIYAKAKDSGDKGTTVQLGAQRPIQSPIEISIPLPFAGVNEAFAVHDGKWQYSATKSDNGMFTFINPHGFSPFEFGVENNTVVSNSRTDYTYLTFSAAADDAKPGDVLTLEKDNAERVTVPVGVRIKVEKDVKFTGTINGKSVTLSTEAIDVPTKDSGNNSPSRGGGGGGSSRPAIKQDETPETPTTPSGGVADFNDVAASAWYANSVKYVVDKGLFGGVGNGNFAPNANMTRAMMWTVLARYMGVNTNTGSNWYEAARAWAIEKGISDGTMADGDVTREQFVTMLWRLSGEPTVDNSASFTDSGTVSNYAKTAVDWAVAQGIVNGYNDGSFKPQGSATRAEVAKMLTVYCQANEKDEPEA